MAYSSDRSKGNKSGRGRDFRGDKPRGERKSWDKPRGDRPWKDKRDGDGEKREFKKDFKKGGFKKDFRKDGERDGDRPWKDKPRGDKKFGDKKFGDRPWKDKKRDGEDFRKEGRKEFKRNDFRNRDDRDSKFKDKKFGDKKFGDRPFKKDFKDRKDFKKDRPFKKDGFKKDFSREEREPRGPRPSLYGFHAVSEAWLNPARKIQTLFLTESAEAEFAPIQKKAYEAGIERPSPTTIDKQKLDYMLQRGAVHQGIALVTDDLDEVSVQDFIIKSKTQDKTVVLILDQVTDPHNVGAILRSACAFGATGIVLQRKNSPLLEGVLAKAASGAVEHLPVAYETNLSRTIEELKEEGFFVFGLDERGEREVGDIMRNNQSKEHKLALVLGAEGPGMRRLVREHCDELVKLPTQGALSSLNVSNAAAVALYALLKG